MYKEGKRGMAQIPPLLTHMDLLSYNRTLGKYAMGRRRDDVQREAEKQRS